jgi:molybdopterin synthase catalytic subunit
MPVILFQNSFEPLEVLHEMTPAIGLSAGEYGASDIFIGTMRNFNEGDEVRAMTLQHYPGMTERELEKLINEAREHFDIQQALIVHRVGEIQPGEAIVITAAWSAHRRDAFEANRYLMEALKSKAPFWKKESLSDGSERWVEKNTPGY